MTDSLIGSSVPVQLSTNGHTGQADAHLSYREAREAPCLSCATSPCCTHLVLSDFQLDSLTQVDHALYLLNFQGIVLGLGRDQKIDVYLHQPCRHLDPDTSLCTVHGTPLQPSVCVQYSGITCSYRTRMTVEVDEVRPLLDYRRMRWLADHVEFDDNRRLVAMPPWEEMLDAFESMPRDRTSLRVPEPDPVREEWRSLVLSGKPARAKDQPTHSYEDPKVSSPCQGCAAYCCNYLVFNRGLPGNASQLDFIRFCLGFPGVEVGIADDAWAVIVRTTCRHLDGNLCSVYGTDERPLRCGYYDAMKCSYRGHFGQPRPADIVRFTYDQFPVLADSIVFDDLGRIVAIPPVGVLRNRLEDMVRAGTA